MTIATRLHTILSFTNKTSLAVHILLVFFVSVQTGCRRGDVADSRVEGVFGHVGLGDGDFSYPRAVATEKDGHVIVVDKSGRLQRFTQDGKHVMTWHMPDTQNGKPVGLSVHPDGRIFVADTHYHRVIVFAPDGTQLASFGELGSGDGQFHLPTDVAFDAQGFVYVSEYNSNDRITKWTPALTFVRAIGDKPIEGKRMRRPAGIAIDAEQTIWVADACNHRVIGFSTDGKVLACFGTIGREPGQMRYPYDIDISPEGTIMVCEYGGDRLQWFDRNGKSLGTWGKSGRKLGELSGPWGAKYGANGDIYVVDAMNSRVQIVRPR